MVFLLCIGSVSAVFLPPECPETSGLQTLTSIQCSGVVYEQESASIETSSGTLYNDPPLDGEETVSIASYNHKLIGRGLFDYLKDFEADTANKIAGQNNIEADTQLQFDNGRAYLTENSYIFATSTGQTNAGEKSICPFTESKTTTNPPFNTEAYMSSTIDVSEIDYSSQFGIRSIAKTTDTPMTTTGTVSGVGTGSIDIKIGVLDQTARGEGTELVKIPSEQECTPKYKSIYVPSSEFKYEERTRALGNFDVNKVFSFTSGINL